MVVIDEAHQLEDITSDTTGLSLGAGRFADLARLARRIVAEPGARWPPWPTPAPAWPRR